MNTLGERLRLTTFGESHGTAIGGVIDGFPSGIVIDRARIDAFMSRRSPGKALTSSRAEKDHVEILSGISPEGISLGTPVGFLLRNGDVRSSDYDYLRTTFRPCHADYTYQCKYGIRDWRGGGRASARETANWVFAGSLASHLTEAKGISVCTWVSGIGKVEMEHPFECSFSTEEIMRSDVRCPDASLAVLMAEEVRECIKSGDSTGGRVSCRICGVPPGLGEPVFGKLQARLAAAMMGINAAKGFEYGLGFEAARRRGSEVADRFFELNGRLRTETNYSGGIQGGISNGEDITFSVAFKPTPSFPAIIEEVTQQPFKGRHDPCVAIRAVTVVEALAHFVIADALLSNSSVAEPK